MDSIRIIDALTHVTMHAREDLLRWYCKLTELERLHVHRLQTELLRRHRERNDGQDIHVLSYAKLVLAIKKQRLLMERGGEKGHAGPEDLKRLSEIRRDAIIGRRARRRKDGDLAREIRVRYYSEISQLRDQGLSWREISEYISRFHKKRFSFTYLQQVCTRIERDNQALEEVDDKEDAT